MVNAQRSKVNGSKRVLLVVMGLLIITVPLLAQGQTFNRKALLKEIKAKLKATNYDDADKTLRKAFDEHVDLKTDDELNYIEMNIQEKLVEAENRKIFLHNKPDTAKYFSHIYNMYNYGLAVSGSSKKYSKGVTQSLLKYRNNLLSGGKFHYMKLQYADAYKYLNMYITTNYHPVLTRDITYQAYQDTLALSRWATIAAFGNKQYEDVLAYLPSALQDTVNRQKLLEIGAKANMELKDSVSALKYLKEGRENDVLNDYFCYSLIDYYTEKRNYEEVVRLSSETYDALPTPMDSVKASRLLYIRGKSEEILQRHDSALNTLKKAIEFNPSDVKGYHSIGTIYLRKAHTLFEQNTSLPPRSAAYRKMKVKLDSYYDLAAKSFENVRKLNEKDTSQWLTELRECYYKLNKGKELKKLEQYE